MKALDVIRREYVENVRKKSFIVSTVLVPVLMLCFFVVPLLFAFFTPSEQVTVAVLDRTGVVAADFVKSLEDTLKDGRPMYIATDATPADLDFGGQKALLIGRINNDVLDVLIEVPEDAVETGRANYITKDVGSISIQEYFEDNLDAVILKRRLAGRGLSYEQVKNLTKPVRLDMQKTTKSGVVKKRGFLEDYAVMFVFVMILYMALLTWGISVQRSIIEEKGSRVIEVMLSSVDSKDLFLGKILGVGAVGLTQIAIWAVTFLAIGMWSTAAFSGIIGEISIPPTAIFYFLLYFVLGFLLYSAIFSIIGAVYTTEQDAQQLQGVVTMPLVVPILFMMLIVQSPNSTASVVLSLIPFFSPMLMLARVVVVEPNLWEIILSVVLLAASIYLVTLFSARVFRVGILMYGKRPSLREVIRWYRYA